MVAREKIHMSIEERHLMESIHFYEKYFKSLYLWFFEKKLIFLYLLSEKTFFYIIVIS